MFTGWMARVIQTGKIRRFPVVLLDRDHWRGLTDWLDGHVAGRALLEAEDLAEFRVVDDAETTAALVLDTMRQPGADVMSRSPERGSSTVSGEPGWSGVAPPRCRALPRR